MLFFGCFADLATATEASPKDPTTGRDLVAARHRMVGLLRATLTVHQRGGGGEEEVRYRNFGVNVKLVTVYRHTYLLVTDGVDTFRNPLYYDFSFLGHRGNNQPDPCPKCSCLPATPSLPSSLAESR